MISNFFLFIFFFRFFFINSEHVRRIRVKKFYGYYQNSDSYPLKNADDGHSDSIAILKYPFILIADLGDYYINYQIDFKTSYYCCGLTKIEIAVSTLPSLDLNNIKNLKKHYFCDIVKNNPIGVKLKLDCYHIPIIIRYLIIHRVYDEDKYDKNKNELMAVDEIYVYGYKYVTYVHKFVGCYRKPRVEFNRTYKSFEECASFCSVQKYYFVSYTEKYCFCVNEMGIKSRFRLCDVQCTKKKYYLCGGLTDQYFPLYLVCFPHNISTECPNDYYSLVGSSCPPNICKTSAAPCNFEGRNCKQNNGGCGKLKCVTEILYGYKYADCFADEGYNLDLNFNISEIDECEYNISECDKTEICINTPGSYTCIKTLEFKVKRGTSIAFLSLLILLFLSLVVYKIATKNQKKKGRKKSGPKKNIEKTFFRI